MATQSHVEQRRNPFETEEYDVTKQRTEPINKTTTTSVQVPDAGTMEFIRQQAAPVAQSMGIDPNTGKVITPFEALGYDPEKERQRREAEQRLNEFKKKESGWYNALSIVGDALTAAHGGNVWRREANRTAAQAEQDNQRLIAEQKADDIANREKLRGKELSYAKYLQDAIAPYLRKTNQTTTEYQQFNDVTHHGAQKGYETTSHVVSDGDGGSGGGSNGMTEVTVRFNVPEKDGVPAHVESQGIKIKKESYDRLGGYLSSVYNQLVKENGQQRVNEILRKAGITPKKPGEPYNGFDLLSSGIIFDDPQVRSEFEKVIRESDMSDEEKNTIIQDMNTYSLTPKEEDGPWWPWAHNKLIKWGWIEDDSPGFKLDGNSTSSTGF